MSDPSSQTLLITGCNGFVGGQLVKHALEKGYNVRGSVRSESSASRLKKDFADYSSQLSVAIVEDMTKPELYEKAFAGNITGVLHLASPFVFDVTDKKKDLLDPAMRGAVSMLEAVQRYGKTVRRVVLTSSFASIVDIPKGLRPGYTYDEKDWNPMTYDEAAEETVDNVVSYCASKKLAEAAAWDWMKENKPSFDLVTICPPWVFGPHEPALKSTEKLNESTSLLWNMIGAKDIPDFDFGGFCDVRVLAEAHIAAIEKEEAGGKRFLCGTHFDYQAAANAALKTIPELRGRIPEGQPDNTLEDKCYKIDGSLAEKVLGIKFTTLEKTMEDSFRELVAASS